MLELYEVGCEDLTSFSERSRRRVGVEQEDTSVLVHLYYAIDNDCEMDIDIDKDSETHWAHLHPDYINDYLHVECICWWQQRVELIFDINMKIK